MKLGTIVDATVRSVEPYGIYLSHNDDTILVLIPEVTWIPSSVSDCREFTQPGQRFRVRILRYVPEREHYLGSLKRAHPDDDPWRNADKFKVGSPWQGKVTHVIHQESAKVISGYIVEVLSGVQGFLPLSESDTVLEVGDSIGVSIKNIDVPSQRIEFSSTDPDKAMHQERRTKR